MLSPLFQGWATEVHSHVCVFRRSFFSILLMMCVDSQLSFCVSVTKGVFWLTSLVCMFVCSARTVYNCAVVTSLVGTFACLVEIQCRGCDCGTSVMHSCVGELSYETLTHISVCSDGGVTVFRCNGGIV
ncbi:hypothetical protein VFPPC_07361 [Pochonia chlamydosporia 170]|uniref:Uncharacterized protein n=1 Tax=Pochonia chlamydosporia 170 TaxID=1380566 RepID=A0A179FA06_METCM|nr:hypothetical protein VFPPC_07361 [Pochonia chlamydosporia 170]OAQ61929.1 hypothetical protein VFPPC_07361 [Pochonia chlamydosporia 170]